MKRAIAIAAVSVLLVLAPALSASAAKTMPKPWQHRDRVWVTCPYKTAPYGRFCLPITTSGWVR